MAQKPHQGDGGVTDIPDGRPGAGLARELTQWQLSMIAIGGMIGGVCSVVWPLC